MPDQKLQEACDEISAILKKHDVAGCVILASPSHMHFRYEITPSWSCAKLQDDNKAIRFMSKRENYSSAQEQKHAQEATIGMFTGFLQIGEKMVDDLGRLLAELSKMVNATTVMFEEKDGS